MERKDDEIKAAIDPDLRIRLGTTAEDLRKDNAQLEDALRQCLACLPLTRVRAAEAAENAEKVLLAIGRQDTIMKWRE